MKHSMKKIGLAAALAAGTALVPAGAALAAVTFSNGAPQINGVAVANGGVKGVVVLRSDVDAVATDVITVDLATSSVTFYDASGARVGGAAFALNALPAGMTVTPTASNDDAGANGDETMYLSFTAPAKVNGADWTYMVFSVAGNEGDGISGTVAYGAVHVGGKGALSGPPGATLSPADQALAFKRTDTYYGPTISKAEIDAARTKLYLTSDVAIKAPSSYLYPTATTGAANNTTFDGLQADGTTVANPGTDTWSYGAHPAATLTLAEWTLGAALPANATKVKINQTGVANANLVTDLAGNPVSANKVVDISPLTAPAFVTASASQANAAVAVAAADYYKLANVANPGTGAAAPDTGIGAAQVALKFNTALDGGTVANTDFEVVDSAGTVIADVTAALGASLSPSEFGVNTDASGLVASSPDTVVLSLTAAGGKKLFLKTVNGVRGLFVDADGALATTTTDQTQVFVRLKASAVSSILGTASSTTPSVTGAIRNAAAPAVIASTNDADANGELDGTKVNFVEPITVTGNGGFTMAVAVNDKPITVTSATVDAVNAGLAVVTFSESEQVDWNNDGVANAADVTYFTETYGTGSTSIYKVALAADSSTVTYSDVVSVSDFKAAKAVVASAAVANDGAAPILKSAKLYTPTGTAIDGNVELTFSEAMKTITVANATKYLATPSGTLQVDLVNTPDAGDHQIAVDGAKLADGIITLTGVDKAILDTLNDVGVAEGNNSVGVAAGASFEGTDNNKVAPKKVNPGAEALKETVKFDVGATVLDATGKNVTDILVFLSNNVAAKVATGASLADVFDVNLVGTPAVADIRPASVSVTDNILTIKLAGNGLTLRQLDKLTGITVDYTPTATTFLHKVGDDTNKITAQNDIQVGMPQQTRNIFSMDLRGRLTTTGEPATATTVVEKGSIVRADVVYFTKTNQVADRINVTVPCDCGTNGTSTIAGTGTAVVDTLITNAKNAGQISANGYLVVTKTSDPADNNDDAGVTAAVAAAPAAAASGVVSYPISIDVRNGRITSAERRISGTVYFDDNATGNQYDVETASTSYGIVDADGNYRVTVGVEDNVDNAFVSLAVKRPNKTWALLSSADKSFANHIPFKTDMLVASATSDRTHGALRGLDEFVKSGGYNGQGVFNMRLDAIATTNVAKVGGTSGASWQTVGFPGELARSRSLNDFTAFTSMVTINQGNGAPIGLWSLDRASTTATGANVEDEAFVLWGNRAASDFEFGASQIQNIRSNFTSGKGLAVRFGADTAGTIVDTGTARTDGLFYMVDPTKSVATVNLPAGWSLLTAEKDEDLAAMDPKDSLAMVVEAGAGKQTRTWIKGAKGNLLNSMEKGKAYFVYLERAVNNAWAN